jgi:hypothetical protein
VNVLFGRQNERDERRAQAWGLWLQERHPLAVVSLVLGIISLIECGVLLVFGIAGIICGAVALKQLADSPAQDPPRLGHRLAWAGILASALSLVVAGLLYFNVVGWP